MTGIPPQKREFLDLSLTTVLSQAFHSVGVTVVVTVLVFPKGTAYRGMKATLLMTNGFAACLDAAQSEMSYEELVCPASVNPALPAPPTPQFLQHVSVWM